MGIGKRVEVILDIVIAGAGGCAREVYDMALDTYSSEEYQVKGFLSDFPEDLDDFPELKRGKGILGTIEGYEIQENDRFLLAIGDVKGRAKVLQKLLMRGAKFISLVHPTVQFFRNVRLGEGVIVYPFVILSDHVHIGDYGFINAYSSIGHDAVLGENTVLCPFTAVGGGAKLGANCFTGPHVTIRPRITIGANSSVSANSFVARSAPEDSFIIGAPAKNT